VSYHFLFASTNSFLKLVLMRYKQMSKPHHGAIKFKILECVNTTAGTAVQVKREDEHTVEDIVGSDSVILNHGEIENKIKDNDDAASAHTIQEEQLLVPADCCVGSECYVQHPPQLVKTPTETEPETSSSIPEKENKKKASGNNASETVLRKKSRNASNLTKLIEKDEAFENRCRELIASKKKFGHCHVPQACPMKEAVTQRPQHMIKPPSKQILDVDHSTPSVSTAGNKAETADDEDVTENINHSADDYDIEVANNTQIDKLYASPKIHERSNFLRE
jgi:hypothetical protein